MLDIALNAAPTLVYHFNSLQLISVTMLFPSGGQFVGEIAIHLCGCAVDARWRVTGVPSDPNPGLFRAGWHVVLLVLCAALMWPFSLGLFPVLSCLLLCHVRSDRLAAAHRCGPSSVLFCCDLEGPLACRARRAKFQRSLGTIGHEWEPVNVCGNQSMCVGTSVLMAVLYHICVLKALDGCSVSYLCPQGP